jgi:Resolvase, N terminal domain
MIAYYRVSTRKQGHSGLGLEAQRAAVAMFAKAEGFEIAAEFTEVESGKGSDALERRPQLKAALKAAKKAKCEVAVAKLDRLSRDVVFISSLMAQRVPFIVCALGRTVHVAYLCCARRTGTANDQPAHPRRPCGRQGPRRQAGQSRAGGKAGGRRRRPR